MREFGAQCRRETEATARVRRPGNGRALPVLAHSIGQDRTQRLGRIRIHVCKRRPRGVGRARFAHGHREHPSEEQFGED